MCASVSRALLTPNPRRRRRLPQRVLRYLFDASPPYTKPTPPSVSLGSSHRSPLESYPARPPPHRALLHHILFLVRRAARPMRVGGRREGRKEADTRAEKEGEEEKEG